MNIQALNTELQLNRYKHSAAIAVGDIKTVRLTIERIKRLQYLIAVLSSEDSCKQP